MPWVLAEELMPDIRMWSGMRLIIDSVFQYQRTSVRACHGISKTFTAAIVAVTFLNRWENSIVVTTAPTHRQVEKLLWKEINAQYQRYGVRQGGLLRGRSTLLSVKIEPDWYMFGFSTDYAVNLEGLHAPKLLWVLDEAKGLPQWLYDGVEGSTTGGVSRVLEISTTDGADQQCPFRQHHTGKKGWRCIRLSAFDSPLVDPDDFPQYAQHRNRALRTYGKPLHGSEWDPGLASKIQIASSTWINDHREGGGEDWEVLRPELWSTKVLGEFASTTENNVIPLDWVMAAVEANVNTGHTERDWGLDVARYGDDEVVLTRKTAGVVKQWVWSKRDTMETIGQALKLIDKNGGADSIRVDADGMGAGVFDRMAELGRPVIAIHSGEAAYESETYANYRAEMWFGLRGLFKEQYEHGNVLSIPNDAPLIEELTGIRYRVRSDSKYLIEDKDAFKKRFHRSPDRADSLVYTAATVYLE